MRIQNAVVVLALAAIAATGCVAASLRTLDTPDRHAVEPRLFGRWEGVTPPPAKSPFDETYWEPGGNWTIEPRPDDTFRATQLDGADTVIYAGSVVRLENRLFLDLQPDSAESARCRVFPIIPCHVFAGLEFHGDTLVVGYLRSDWLSATADQGHLPPAVGLTLTEDDDALLTGETPDLQALMVRAAQAREALSIGKLVRAR